MLLAKLCVPPLAMKVAPLPVSPILKSDPLFTVVPSEMIVPPLKLITLLAPLVASNCFTVTVPPATFSVPKPFRPMLILPLLTVRLPLLMLTELFADPACVLMNKSLPTATVPPLEMTRLLPLPNKPTASSVVLVQSELLPVTRTELFEDPADELM